MADEQYVVVPRPLSLSHKDHRGAPTPFVEAMLLTATSGMALRIELRGYRAIRLLSEARSYAKRHGLTVRWQHLNAETIEAWAEPVSRKPVRTDTHEVF